MKLELFFTLYKKINLVCIKGLNVRLEMIKILEENIGKIFIDIYCSNIFLGLSLKVKETKTK